jgi:hypothetical protein
MKERMKRIGHGDRRFPTFSAASDQPYQHWFAQGIMTQLGTPFLQFPNIAVTVWAVNGLF